MKIKIGDRVKSTREENLGKIGTIVNYSSKPFITMLITIRWDGEKNYSHDFTTRIIKIIELF